MQDVNDEFFSHHFSKRRENSEMINSREYVNLMPCDKCAETRVLSFSGLASYNTFVFTQKPD